MILLAWLLIKTKLIKKNEVDVVKYYFFLYLHPK